MSQRLDDLLREVNKEYEKQIQDIKSVLHGENIGKPLNDAIHDSLDRVDALIADYNDGQR